MMHHTDREKQLTSRRKLNNYGFSSDILLKNGGKAREKEKPIAP